MPDQLKPSPLPATPKPVSMMPQFAQPTPPPNDPAPTPAASERPDAHPPTSLPLSPARSLRERLGMLKPDHGDTPTGIYSPGKSAGDEKSGGAGSKPTKQETAELIAGILGLVVLGIALVVDQRGRKLRKPTHDEYGAIATPIARIVLRHADGEWLHPDLVDVLVAGNAVGGYINSGEPLITHTRAVDDGVPADLQETHQ